MQHFYQDLWQLSMQKEENSDGNPGYIKGNYRFKKGVVT